MDFGRVFVETVWVLIPLTVLAIPLLGVIGKVIVKPITQAITRLADADRELMGVALDRRFAEIDERLARIERQLGRVVEAEARRQLDAGPVPANLAALTPRSAPPVLAEVGTRSER